MLCVSDVIKISFSCLIWKYEMDSTSKSTESIPDLFQLQMQCTGLTTALREEKDKPSDNSYILHNYNINKSYQYRQTTTTNIQSILHIQSNLWKPQSQYDMLSQKDYIHYNSIQITNYIHCIVSFYRDTITLKHANKSLSVSEITMYYMKKTQDNIMIHRLPPYIKVDQLHLWI